jgi:hypothetical protein
MTTWTTTTAEQDIIEALDSEQRPLLLLREWGCDHDEALTIATDDTGRLFTQIMEKTFG